MSSDAPPTHITLGSGALTLQWPDGQTVRLPAVALRRHCRCADCRSATLRGRAPTVTDEVRLANATPVGHYALQLHFSDSHERGIYPWAYLREIAQTECY